MVDIITRASKGSPVSWAEADQNLINLKEAIESLDGLQVLGWDQDEDGLLTIELTNGQSIGPLVLPASPIRFLGEWVPQAYLKGDAVSRAGSSFVAKADIDSEDLEAEFAAGDWFVLGVGATGDGEGGGGGAAELMHPLTATLIGTMPTGDKLIGMMIVPAGYSAEIKATHAAQAEMKTAAVSGTFNVQFKKTASAMTTNLGTVMMSSGFARGTGSFAATADEGDLIEVWIIGGDASGSDLTVTVPVFLTPN